MLDPGFYNMDCMKGMEQFPDGFFDLAIVDPPYGINVGGGNPMRGGASEQANHSAVKHKVYGASRRMLCKQNFTIPSTTTVRRAKVIFASLNA